MSLKAVITYAGQNWEEKVAHGLPGVRGLALVSLASIVGVNN